MVYYNEECEYRLIISKLDKSRPSTESVLAINSDLLSVPFTSRTRYQANAITIQLLFRCGLLFFSTSSFVEDFFTSYASLGYCHYWFYQQVIESSVTFIVYNFK